MFNTVLKNSLGRKSWCATLSTVVIAACGGGSGTESVDETTSATNTGQTPTVAVGEADTKMLLASESVSPAATDSATAADTGWYFCSNEGQTCTFDGTRLVRYGANNSYVHKSATKSIQCNSTAFGKDPAPGVAKSCSISSSPSPYGQDAAQFTLTFRDEFSGTSLDTSKWNDHIWYEAPSSTNDYGVSGGYLKIWPQADANGEFKSRILTTAGKFSQTYGYFEMEAKLPIGHGPWPAFWLLNSDNPDVGEPEIDIMEAYPGDETGYWADANNHPIRYGASFYQNGNGANPPGQQGTQGIYTGDLSTGFHKYAVKWEPNKLSYYFDGKLVYSANVSMSKTMYILLDMQYGSSSGSVDSTTPLGPNNSFQINYARAWKLK